MNERIVFMGTPDFAAAILKALCEAGENVVCAVTQTDKPSGRGYKLIPTAVKEYAESHGIPVYQPKTLRPPQAAADVAALEPELIITAAYGKILPREILDIPRLGCINVHGSLLPYYRGAAPVQRCIMDGAKKTGVTLMRMDEGCDTGGVIDETEIAVTPELNCGELFEKMAFAGSELLLRYLPKIKRGCCKCTPQDTTIGSYASKIEKSELSLDFTKPAECLHNAVRGVYPFLCCECVQHTPKGDRRLKITKTRFSSDDAEGECGEVLSADAKAGEIAVKCGKGVLYILELIPEGKSKMSASDYVRGRQISPGDSLQNR